MPTIFCVRLFGILLAVGLLSSKALTATVNRMTSKGIEISVLPEETFRKGELFYVLDDRNMRVAVVEVVAVETDNVLAKLRAGRASAGQKLVKRTSRDAATARSTDRRPASATSTMAYTSTAETKFAGRFGAGATYFSFGGSGAGENKNRLGFNVGAYFEPSRDRLSLSTGLVYYQAGAISTSNSVEIDLALGYLGIPLAVKYDLLPSEAALRLKGGFMAAYLVDATLKLSSGGSVAAEPADRTDYLFLSGIEYASAYEDTEYWIELSYLYGLKNYVSASGARFNNRGTLLALGFSF